MSELTYKTGEVCRIGDLVLIDGKTLEVTGLGKTRVFMMAPGQPHHEPSFIARFGTLLRRAGETEDRDREKYEYLDDGTTPDFYEGWEMIVKEPPLVFRRLLQPEAPAKPPLGIMPERLWLETRLAEIAAAVNRYNEAGLPKPAEWAKEASRLEAVLRLLTSQPEAPAKPLLGSDGQSWPQTFDGQVWAKEFIRHVQERPEIATDEGTMIGWFANAIMVGYDRPHATEPSSPAPAKPPFDPNFAPPGFVAKPCPDGHACVGCHFTLSANNGEECPPRCMAINRPDGQNSIFVKADPAPAKPKFEAVVWPVEREASGACYALSAAHKILAYIGNGILGFTIAGFFRDQASAETFAEQYRREGRIGCGYWETPMIVGNPAKFCVATRSNDETRS